MSNALIQLIVLAAIAIFLILRLKNILGTREGFENPAPPPEPLPNRTSRRGFDVIEGGADRDIIDHVPDGSPAARALADIKAVEPDFSVSQFLHGASSAYEMILMAFEKGDLTQIRPFLAPEVYEAFESVVTMREERGLTVHAEFLGLREMVLTEASFDQATKRAELTLRFTGELISSARDSSGKVVEGDPKTPRKQRDHWSFARVIGSPDPNWQLVATGG